jgi:hypothetical protein
MKVIVIQAADTTAWPSSPKTVAPEAATKIEPIESEKPKKGRRRRVKKRREPPRRRPELDGGSLTRTTIPAG